jgi:hypothetical protein
MQLRNGKQVKGVTTCKCKKGEGSDEKAKLVSSVRKLLDEANKYRDSSSDLEKIYRMTPVFEKIGQESAETLSTIDDSLKFVSTLYMKTMELTCTLIERSYNRLYTSEEKCAVIRLLSEMYKARRLVTQILWDGRLTKNIQDMLETGERHSEQIYRCLKHIASDESESRDYQIYTYDDGEYTDEELYDWYFLDNYRKDASEDSYMSNADECFGAKIRRFNGMLWR